MQQQGNNRGGPYSTGVDLWPAGAVCTIHGWFVAYWGNLLPVWEVCSLMEWPVTHFSRPQSTGLRTKAYMVQ